LYEANNPTVTVEIPRFMSILAKNITKRFGATMVLDDVSLEVPSGSLVALLGPSGSGKTTLLRIVAGLETPDTGWVQYRDDDITNQSARDRNMGFVFQHYALFKHMTVFENVAFGLRVRKWPESRIRERVRELLHLVRLDEMADRFPSQLSGGQKQRIALVRALAPEPKVILLDEPFGALDAKVREELRVWLRKFHDEYHVTSIFVTHDQAEAFEVADRVVVMSKGRIEQAGSPGEVFEHPANEFVMDFLGNVNVITARMEGGRILLGPVEMPVEQGRVGRNASGEATVFVRPHELDLSRMPVAGKSLGAKVVHINPAGSVVKVRVVAENFGLVLNIDVTPDRYKQLGLRVGEEVYVTPKSAKVFGLPLGDQDYAI
jgi:sulfate transport system ATP-binding protein